MKKLLNIYYTAIRPVEQAFKYNELRQHEVTGEEKNGVRLRGAYTPVRVRRTHTGTHTYTQDCAE